MVELSCLDESMQVGDSKIELSGDLVEWRGCCLYCLVDAVDGDEREEAIWNGTRHPLIQNQHVDHFYQTSQI